MNDLVDSLPVKRVRHVLAEKQVKELLHELPGDARSAREAARALGVELGAVAKTLVYEIGLEPVMVVIAGDRRCDEARLPELFGLEGEVRRCDAVRVEELTGFPVGGVAPVGSLTPMPVVVDASLARFPRIYAGAGHPRVLMELSFDDLLFLTGGTPSEEVAVEG